MEPKKAVTEACHNRRHYHMSAERTNELALLSWPLSYTKQTQEGSSTLEP